MLGLLRRLLAMLEEDGYVRGQADTWTVVPQATTCNPDAALTQLLEQKPTARPEIELLQRCARHLLAVMRGETDPLKLLFPADNSISAGDLYRDSVGGRAMNALVAEAVAQVGKALPDGRTLRILEIGAGTGATTAVDPPAASRRSACGMCSPTLRRVSCRRPKSGSKINRTSNSVCWISSVIRRPRALMPTALM